MSLKTEIAAVLNTDASILYYCDADNIFYTAAEDNLETSNNYITFFAQILSNRVTFDDTELPTYQITVNSHSTSPVTSDSLAKEIQRALNEYSSTNVLNIYLNNEDEIFNTEANMYKVVSSFNSLYIK